MMHILVMSAQAGISRRKGALYSPETPASAGATIVAGVAA